MNIRIGKHLPALGKEQIDRLNKLAKLSLAVYGEQDVRENFLAPLIELLGYERGRDYDVLTEDMKGHFPFHVMLGSAKFRLDYRFVVWKQGFWLLEAKRSRCDDPSDPPDINETDVGQAFAYALHPQIDTPYFAVSNGWWTKLYDRDGSTKDPILSIAQHELPARFDELRRIVGAEQITFHLKRRLLTRIEQVLSADIVLNRSDEFLYEVERVCHKVRPKVLENFRAAARKSRIEPGDRWKELVATTRPFELIETALSSAWSTGEIQAAGNHLAERVLADLPESGNTYLFFSKLLIEELRPVTTQDYINSLYVLCALASRSSEQVVLIPQSVLPGSSNRLPLREIFALWADLLLHHLSGRPPLRMIWAMEALLGRLAKRFLVYAELTRKSIVKAVDVQRFLLPEEMLASISASPAGSLLVHVKRAQLIGIAAFIREHYEKRNRQWHTIESKQEFKRLLDVEDKLSAATPDYFQLLKELGSDWSELLSVDHANVTVDDLGLGVCAILTTFPDLLKALPVRCHERIHHLAQIGEWSAIKCCALVGKDVQPFDAIDAQCLLTQIFDPFSDLAAC